MKSVVMILVLALGIQGSMSENDIGRDGCIVPAVCKRLGYIETVWMPIARPVCEAGFAMKKSEGEVGLKGENGHVGAEGKDGQQGKVGLKGDNGTRGENGSNGEIGAKGEKGIKGRFGQKGGPASGVSFVFKKIMKVLCPVKHENKCFFPVIGRKVGYDGGVAICERLGGHLANIYSQTHMVDVMKYIKANRWDGSGWMDFRVGMKYDPKAEKLTLRDGTNASNDLKWHDRHPKTFKADARFAGHTTVMLQVNSDLSSIWNYFFNRNPSERFYVLCEIE